MTLRWKGKQARAEIERGLEDALIEIGLRVEGAAKEELQPGHGVETGTLRRSIHAADPEYNFAGDDVAPSASSPERGGQAPKPKTLLDRMLIAIGSGLKYALPVHQGHHSFDGYHYITLALEKVKKLVPGIVKKNVAGRKA